MRPLPPAVRRHHRSAWSVSRLALAVAFLAATACVRHGRADKGAENDNLPMPVPEFVYVNVENHNTSDVIVALVAPNGQTLRMGTVTGASSGVLRFPGRYIAGSAPLHLTARAIGGRTEVRSERFTVQPGQQVSWTLETSLQRSSLAVY